MEQLLILPYLSFGMFTITNSATIGHISLVFVIIFFLMAHFKVTLITKGGQIIAESFYTFILNLVNEGTQKFGQPFFPIMFTTFIFILSCNLFGLVPYSFTVTSHIIVTFGLALSLFIGLNLIGIRIHGVEILGLFLPPGSPLPMVPLLVAIESVLYISRVFSLSIRLFANMVAGHMLLKIIIGFALTLAMLPMPFFLVHLVPVIIVIAIMGLETGVAMLQAFVFTMLLVTYLDNAISLH
jgi:ATP synthase subunit 6